MLWIIYPKRCEVKEKIHMPKYMCECADDNNIPHALFFHEYFEIKNNTLFYNGTKIDLLPSVALFRCYNQLLMQFLENNGVHVINNATSAYTSKDKFKTYAIAEELKITKPQTHIAQNHTFEELASRLSLPFVLKDNFGMQGKNVYLINSKAEFEKIIQENPSITFIAQTFIKKSEGKDVRLYVVGDSVVSSIMRISKAGDFRANISQGGTSELFDVPDFIKTQSIKLAQKIGLEICSVDYLFDGKNYIFCESNSNAGFSAFFAHDIDMPKHFMKHIKEKYFS